MGVCHCLWFHAETNKQIFFFFNLGVDNHLLADSPRFPPPALLVFSAVLSSTRRGSHLKVVSQGPHRVKSCGAFERSWTDVKRKDGRRMEQMEAKQMLHWNQRKTIYIYIVYHPLGSNHVPLEVVGFNRFWVQPPSEDMVGALGYITLQTRETSTWTT